MSMQGMRSSYSLRDGGAPGGCPANEGTGWDGGGAVGRADRPAEDRLDSLSHGNTPNLFGKLARLGLAGIIAASPFFYSNVKANKAYASDRPATATIYLQTPENGGNDENSGLQGFPVATFNTAVIKAGQIWDTMTSEQQQNPNTLLKIQIGQGTFTEGIIIPVSFPLEIIGAGSDPEGTKLNVAINAGGYCGIENLSSKGDVVSGKLVHFGGAGYITGCNLSGNAIVHLRAGEEVQITGNVFRLNNSVVIHEGLKADAKDYANLKFYANQFTNCNPVFNIAYGVVGLQLTGGNNTYRDCRKVITNNYNVPFSITRDFWCDSNTSGLKSDPAAAFRGKGARAPKTSYYPRDIVYLTESALIAAGKIPASVRVPYTLAVNPFGDEDNNGIPNLEQEGLYGYIDESNPGRTMNDADGDGAPDALEIQWGTDPYAPDHFPVLPVAGCAALFLLSGLIGLAGKRRLP